MKQILALVILGLILGCSAKAGHKSSKPTQWTIAGSVTITGRDVDFQAGQSQRKVLALGYNSACSCKDMSPKIVNVHWGSGWEVHSFGDCEGPGIQILGTHEYQSASSFPIHIRAMICCRGDVDCDVQKGESRAIVK